MNEHSYPESPTARFSKTKEIPREKIKLAPEMFQGREGAFAEETVEKIVREGFDKSREPIVVWTSPEGEHLLISGHSRFEASGRLLETDASLKSLPVKFFLGSEQEAMDFALLESNRSGTEEGLKSDLAAYKRARERGFNRSYLKGLFKPERRLRFLENLAALDQQGMFLKYLDSDSEKHFPYLRRNAVWAGQIRKQLPQLSNAHERELFAFLYPTEGKKKRLEVTKDKFFERVNRRVSRIDFDLEKPLMLEDMASANPITDPARQRLKELDEEINGYERERSKLDERIAKSGDEKKVEQLQERQRETGVLIQRVLEEKRRIESEIGRLERETTSDLFSQGNPVVQKQEVVREENPGRLIREDNWFVDHPEAVLGEAYQTTDRFGKPETRIRGGMEDLKRIPVETLIPKWKGPVRERKLNDKQRENLEKSIRRTGKAQRREMHREASGLANDQEMFSFEEILREYNPGISEEEIRVWVWHGKDGGQWSDFQVENEAAALAQWLEKGLVCLDGNDYLPAPLYYSEDIAGRIEKLEENRALLVLRHGKAQYERQLEGLKEALPQPLRLDDPVIENRLVINPLSEFADELKVTELADGTLFTRINVKTGAEEEAAKPILKAFERWMKTLSAKAFGKSNLKYIVRFYLERKHFPKTFSKEERSRVRRHAKAEGNRLFARFLAEGISEEDRRAIEALWNRRYNSYAETDYSRIPVAFSCSRSFKNKPLFIRPAQREGIGFITARGSGCLAYDVGLGKTMTAILSLAQALESGRCKRPLIIVPNSTYGNWLEEIRGRVENGKITSTGILPQYTVNDLFNLSEAHLSMVLDEEGNVLQVGEKTITVMTYEGFNRLGFREENWALMKGEFHEVLNQGLASGRDEAKLLEKIDELMGRGSAGGLVSVEDLGFDFLVVDEAHAMKKSFTRVKGTVKDKKRSRSPYAISSGEPSSTALRGFMLASYIQRTNARGNVLLLTATPFTNSPLEIYSMLALVAHKELAGAGVKNLVDFFDTYIATSNELVMNVRLKPERREVVLGFNNLVSLQRLISRFIRYKSGEEANIRRPEKLVLPSEVNDISTQLPMTPRQAELMEEIAFYLRGGPNPTLKCDPNFDPATWLSMEEEEPGARVLRSVSLASQIALSPWLFPCPTGPTPKQYVEDSPKLRYTMRCIESVRAYAEKTKVEMPGQLIYMNAGVEFFPLILRYLKEAMGFAEREVDSIHGGISAARKEAVKNRFLSGEIKVLLGSASIREGINLQYRATDLYVLWLDWNPTDLKQLEGRIWRQGNQHARIRITYPLVENTIDIFKFQKLQEKTARINGIWQRAGRRNTLDLEDFNPAELKRSLITDPEGVAELLVIEEKERMEEEIAALQERKKGLARLAKAREVFQKHYPDALAIANRYKPSRSGDDRKVETVLRIYREWLEDPAEGTVHVDAERLKRLRTAWRIWQRGLRDTLEPLGIGPDFDVEEETERLAVEIESQKKQMEERTGEEAVERIAEEIKQERDANKERPATVEERAGEFGKLNSKVVGVYMESAPPIPKKEAKEQGRSADLLDDIGRIQQMVADMRRLEQISQELKKLIAA